MQGFLGYDSKQKDGSHLEGTITLIASLGFCAVTVIRCSVEKEKCVEHSQKEYSDTYGTLVETAAQQLIGNVTEFVKHWSSEELPEED